ncbi:MAG: ABC transporter permease subunit [Cellulomonas sp.]
MSTHTLTTPTDTASGTPSSAGGPHLTFPRIVRSEWIKFRTLRSTLWALGATLVVMVGIVTLFSGVIASQSSQPQPDQGGMSSTITVFWIAATMAQLVVAVLGVLVVTGEYSTGMIRSTLAAVPKRLPALWAKGVVMAVSIFVISSVAVGLSLISMQLFLSSKDLMPDLGDPDNMRILVGVPLYLTAIAVFSFAIGAILRHSAGALATVLGLLLVVENLFQIPWKPLQYISPLMPGTAGIKILQPQAEIDMMAQMTERGADLSAWQGYGVLVIWTIALLAIAALLMKRRDA